MSPSTLPVAVVAGGAPPGAPDSPRGGKHDEDLVSALLAPCPDISGSAQAVDSDIEQLEIDDDGDKDDDKTDEAADAT